MAKTIKVPKSRWSKFLANLKRLNERAVLKGLAQIQFEEVGEDEAYVIPGGGLDPARVPYIEVKVTSAPVASPNWTLLACRTEAKGVSRIQHFAPGREVPLYLLEGDLTCQHCNTVRHRTRTFFVLNIDNRISQVGHGCLSEYTGLSLTGVSAGAKLLDALDKLLEESALVEASEEEVRKSGAMLSTVSVVAHALAVLKEHEWVSRAMAERRDTLATADRVGARIHDLVEISSEDLVEAAALLRRIRDHYEDNPPTEAFEARLGSILYGDEMLRMEQGQVAWAVYKHGTVKPPPVESQYVGTPKARLDLTVTVDRVVELGVNKFGAFSELVLMRDGAGNRLVWKTASRPSGIKEGSSHAIRGTVTAHELYKAQRQTTLSRVSFE